MRRSLVSVLAAICLVSGGASADGGALPPVKVRFEGGALKIDVAGMAERTQALDLHADEIPDAAKVEIETLPIGGGKSVTHVTVPSMKREGVAWEAIVAGTAQPVIVALATGYTSGEEGERMGMAIDVVEKSDGTNAILVGTIFEQLRLCGQDQTMVAPRALDPKTLELRGATVQRLTPEQRDGATRIVASVHGGPAEAPLAKLLTTSGASTAIGKPGAVTDGDASTTWAEERPGDGHGEFVVMRAPSEVPIPRLSITFAPPAVPAESKGAAPKTFYLVTNDKTFAVTMPEDAWMHPGHAYDLAFAEPLRASCLSLVLDAAYTRAGNTHPDVSVAEVSAYSDFDAPTAKLDDVVSALAGGGTRAQTAAAILKRAGAAALAVTTAKFDSLDAGGRALAIDVAASAGTCDAAPLLVKALADADHEVARKAREKVERCGKTAAPALALAVESPDEKARVEAATLLSSIAPSLALDALSAQAGLGKPETRSAIRRGIARAARGANETQLAKVVSDEAGGAEGKLDRLRALESDLPKVRGPADAAIGGLASAAPAMRTRYLLVGPIASLARAGDATALAKLNLLITGDPDPAVRAHATESAAILASARPALVHALGDAAPRVREAAARAMEHAVTPDALEPLTALVHDEWTFVRAASLVALASAPPSPATDEVIASRITDDAPAVRASAIAAIGARNARAFTKKIRERFTEEREDPLPRAAAARALGELCDRESIGALKAHVAAAALPLASEADTQIGAASAAALAALSQSATCR